MADIITERDPITTWADIEPTRKVAPAVAVATEKHDIAERVYLEKVNYFEDNPDEWDQPALDALGSKADAAYEDMLRVKHAALNECTCLPDLPDGRGNGGRGGCCPACEIEIRLKHDEAIPF